MPDIDYDLVFRKPGGPLPQLLTAEDVIAKSSLVAATAAIDEKQRELDNAKQVLTLMPEDSPAREHTLKWFKDLEAALAKLRKAQPGSKVYAQQLRSAKQSHHELLTKWDVKIADGKAKADERLAQQLKALEVLSSSILERRGRLQAARDEAGHKWNVHNDARRTQWTQVLAQFDIMIASVEATGVPGSTGGPTAQASEVPRPDAAAGSGGDAALAAARQDADAAKQALARLQEQFLLLQQAQAQQPSEPPPSAAPPASFACEATDLPTELPGLEEADRLEYHRLCTALDTLAQHEAVAGAPIPVTFAQLQCGLVLPKLLLGPSIWEKAFPGEEPSPDTPVTPQVRSLMVYSLRQLKPSFEDVAMNGQEIKRMKTHIDVIAFEARKRQRTAAAQVAAA